jgi:hypothetical protein
MATDATTVEQARRAALAAVANALRAQGVPFFVVPSHTGAAYRLGVVERYRAELNNSLLSLTDTDWRVKQARGQVHSVARLASMEPGDVVTVFRRRTWERSTFRLGPEAGVQIEIWAESPAGWRAPAAAPNSVTRLLPPSVQHEVTVTTAGSDYPTAHGLQARPWDDIDFPIDVVYTWVDGADPDWVAARDRRLAELGGAEAVPAASWDDSRFADHDELRYSLRSVDQFLPWVRTVQLVTAGQRPNWLAADHPRLRVVDHRDILDADALPTFNSQAIETALHHIPDLSEHFVYLNDDVFIGRPIEPRTFFRANGTSVFFPRSAATLDPAPVSPDDLPVVASNKNARALLEAEFGRRIAVFLRHAPHPLRRSLMAELEHRFGDQARSTRRSPFRSRHDVAFVTALYHYYAFYTRQAAPGPLRHLDVTLGTDGVERRLDRVGKRRLDSFCLNDTVRATDDPADRDRLVRGFLESYYPQPSSFER